MEVYLVTEKSEIFDDIQLIFEDYDDAKAYAHDEIEKIERFVENHPCPIELEPEYEVLVTRFEEPILDKKYIGTLFVSNKFWETNTPIATIKISARPVMLFDDGELKCTKATYRRPTYISYGERTK